jgi:hypothetical protein
MKGLEIMLEYVYTNSQVKKGSGVDSGTLTTSIQMLETLSREELLSEVTDKEATNLIENHPDEQPEFYLANIFDYNYDDDDMDFPKSDPPLNCSVPLTQAAGGRRAQASELLEHLIQRGIATESLQTEVFRKYEHRRANIDSSSNKITIIGSPNTTNDEDQLASRFLKWLSNNNPDFKFAQQEVPLGIHRAAASLDREINTDVNISNIFSESSVTGRPEGFFNDSQVAYQFGAGVLAGTGNVDLVVSGKERSYVVELKTDKQRIDSLSDIYQSFGQARYYGDCFIEDYPSIAAESDPTPILVAASIGIDKELIEPTFKKHNVGVFDAGLNQWLVHPGQ